LIDQFVLCYRFHGLEKQILPYESRFVLKLEFSLVNPSRGIGTTTNVQANLLKSLYLTSIHDILGFTRLISYPVYPIELGFCYPLRELFFVVQGFVSIGPFDGNH